MKLLIVTAWYAPFTHPRAHRWTAVAEQWSTEGHEVHILTARIRDQYTAVNGVRIHRVGFDSLKEWIYYRFGVRDARGRVGVKPVKPGLLLRLAVWVYNAVWKNLYFPDDAGVWYLPAKRKLTQLLENEDFDAIITVSLPFTGHLLGLQAIRKRNETAGVKPVWLADIGDPFFFQAKSPNNRFFFQKINRHLERKVLETADVVTVTTHAALDRYRAYFGEKAVSKMAVIPPLITNPPISYHPSTYPPITKIGYFGAFYAPTRTPDAFLDLLAQTFTQRPDVYGHLEIHFYGEVFPEFYDRLQAEPAIQLHGLCSREEVARAMQKMDGLLNIGNTTDFQLPSKAVDYLASGKPVLNLSYVNNDPFAEFFKDNPLVFNLKIENGRVTSSGMREWLEWLECEKPGLGKAEIARRTEPFLVEKIAGTYLELLRQGRSFAGR